MTLAPILFVLANALYAFQDPPPPGPPPPPGLTMDGSIILLIVLALLYGIIKKIMLVKTMVNR